MEQKEGREFGPDHEVGGDAAEGGLGVHGTGIGAGRGEVNGVRRKGVGFEGVGLAVVDAEEGAHVGGHLGSGLIKGEVVRAVEADDGGDGVVEGSCQGDVVDQVGAGGLTEEHDAVGVELVVPAVADDPGDGGEDIADLVLHGGLGAEAVVDSEPGVTGGCKRLEDGRDVGDPAAADEAAAVDDDDDGMEAGGLGDGGVEENGAGGAGDVGDGAEDGGQGCGRGVAEGRGGRGREEREAEQGWTHTGECSGSPRGVSMRITSVYGGAAGW